MIAFTQYMIRWCLLYPILHSNNYAFQFNEFLFFLLVLSTVLVAAAGYIINDYFDVRIDKINKPERLVIDHGVKRRVAIAAHTVLNFIAVTIGFFVSWQIGFWQLGFVHLLAASGLWVYSTQFKRQFFIGNFVISSFTALVPLIVGVYELASYANSATMAAEVLHLAWVWVLAMTFFAFITTLLREIIKDIEDVEGDQAYGCKTMPVIIGKRASKNVSIAIMTASMFTLGWIQYLLIQQHNFAGFFYILILIQFPFLVLIYRTNKAESKQEYHAAGRLAKLIMFVGICYLFLFSYQLLS